MDGGICLKGWAVDINVGGSIKEVQFLSNGKLIDAVSATQNRPDVAAHFQRPDFVHSGWDYRFERDRVRSDEVIGIKVVNHKGRSTITAYDLLSSMAHRVRAAG